MVGTIRNGAKFLEKEVERFEQVFGQIGNVSFYLVESDSQDATLEVLKKLSDQKSNFLYKSMGFLLPEIPSRIERITLCRNEYVAFIRQSLFMGTEDYVVVVDFDNRHTLLNAESIRIALSREVEWSALFANQKGKYYDLLALRHPIWCPNNIYDELNWYRENTPSLPAKKYAIFNKMLCIPPYADLISVDSAFGGLGIYKAELFQKHDYQPMESDSKSECEHVVLNRKIGKEGGCLYIDPQLTNFSWIQHSLESYKVWRFIFQLKKFLHHRMGCA